VLVLLVSVGVGIGIGMDGEALSKNKESEPAYWPTFNGWAGVIFFRSFFRSCEVGS